MTQDATPSPSPRNRGCRRIFSTLTTLFLLLLAYRFYTLLVPSRLEIGPDTTVIEGPLLPDGRVDYVRALNERMSNGVAPANNAAIPLAQAFGPEIVEADVRTEYFRLLGVPVPPLPGNHVIDETAWLQRNGPPITHDDLDQEQELLQQFGDAAGRPWSAEEFPEVAAWLEANEAPLELIVAATNHPRFYSPLVAGVDQPLPQIEQPLHKETRAAAHLLTTRAMLRLGEGDLDGAWEDLLACHRLARLVGQGGTLFNVLRSASITAIATRPSVSLAQDGRMTPAQARGILADLEALSPLPDFSATMDRAERFSALDSIQSMRTWHIGLSCGPAMRRANQRYDNIVAAFRNGTHRQRIERLHALEQELREADGNRTSASEMAVLFLIGGRDRFSRQFAERFITMQSSSIAHLGVAEARAETRLRLLRITLMLAAFRADHGSYPDTLDTLDTLTPGYLTTVPLDPFLDAPFNYERTASGYRLYSVGRNMTDDDGRTFESEPHGDDILVETPLQLPDHGPGSSDG